MPSPEHVHRHWQCECHDAHFLTICYWPEDADALGPADFSAIIDIGGNYWANWRMRWKMARQLLRHGHVDTNVGLLLSREDARELAAELTDFATTGSAPGTGSRTGRRTGDTADPPGTGS